jgi:hypothetical protein
MATPTPSRPSLLQRIRRILQPGAGDVIMANVGQGASDVIVGKNILKIGTLVIPALPVVVAVIIALAAAGTTLWLYLVPATMSAPFNVAIAQLGVIDARGREHPADADSAKISKTLFTSVQEELRQLPTDYKALVWHDSMSFLQKRSTIGVIGGTTLAERATAACTKARALNADMIVYGQLDERSAPAVLRLQFCFQSITRSRDIGSLEELQKADRLGSPLLLDLPLTDVSSSANPPLKVRTTLAAKLVVGLRYELGGEVNFQASLNRALAVFTKTLDYLKQEDGDATRENGGDVVHYFIGREHCLLAQDQATPQDKKAEQLAAASSALQQAVDLNPQFSRAYTALGGVYFQQIRQQIQDPSRSRQTIDDALAQMIIAYQTAIATATAAPDPPAEAEAHLALALGEWLQANAALTRQPPDSAAAEVALQQADQQRAIGAALIQPAQVRLRGFAEMIRGVVANRQAELRIQAGDTAGGSAFFRQARDAYDTCSAAGRDDPGDQFLKQQIIATTCVPGGQAVTKALQQLQQ